MCAKSIGSVYVDVLAKLGQLEQDMERAKKTIGGLSDETAKSGAAGKAAFESFSLFNSFKNRGMIGIVSDMTALTLAVSAVRTELKYMFDNIERIPTISPEARAGIIEFKTNLSEARDTLAGFLAEAINFGLLSGKAIGVGAAQLMGYDEALKEAVPTMDAIAKSNDPAFWDKVANARMKAAESARAESVANQITMAGRIDLLKQWASDYEKYSKSATINTLQRLEFEAKAHEKNKEALNLEKELNDKYLTSQKKEGVEAQKEYLIELTQLGRVRELRRLINDEWLKMTQAHEVKDGADGIMTDAQKEAIVQRMIVLVGWQRQLREELHKIKKPTEEMRDSFIQAFSQVDEYITSFITGGKLKIDKFLLDLSNSIINTFVKLAILNPLLNGIFGGGVGGALLPAFFGPGATKGKAEGGPGSGLTWVGEHGPELLNLPAGSYVNDAQASRNMGGRGGNVYNIDARGADMGVADRLERMMLQLAGPGVVEQRALSAAADAKWRRS